jgi:3-oxoadipate enol-lactonase
MPEFISNGMKLNYFETGNGTPLILIHGLTASLTMFNKDIEHLKDNFRVIALDLRGHGKSDKPLEYTLDDHVQDVIALMDYLGIDRANILGASMGSYVAQGVATERPELVNKLILVVAKSHGKISSSQEMLVRHAEELKGLTEEEQMNYLFRRTFHNIPAVVKSFQETPQDEPMLTPEQQAAANKALEGFDFRSKLHKVTAETLVISGRYDGLNPPERGREIASLIPKALFVEYEKSGHAPNVEESERFLKEITEFLQKI